MTTSAAAVHYVIDTRASQFTVQAFADGLIKAIAHSPKIAIRDWTGGIHVSSGTPEGASLQVRVHAGSLEVLDELRDDDRREIHRVMNKDVLETVEYPEIVFESAQVKAERLKDDLYRVHVAGRLKLHGITNDHEFGAQVAFGVDSIRSYGAFTLRQTDYDIRIASIAGGTLKLQDELKFSFYVVARKPD